ncbi:hypothetical protein CATMIT_01947, partial [Catenibacterium mitsuokai DSM 15897]
MKIRKLLLPAAIVAALAVLVAPSAFAQQDPQADKKAEEAKKADDAKKAEAKKKAEAGSGRSPATVGSSRRKRATSKPRAPSAHRNAPVRAGALFFAPCEPLQCGQPARSHGDAQDRDSGVADGRAGRLRAFAPRRRRARR